MADLLDLIDVTAGGAVHLGEDIVCDGFSYDASARVQTHVHEDHMDEFDSSKGFQQIFMSSATRELLIAERNADLPLRDNVIALESGIGHDFAGSQITLVGSNHMLGAVQTVVQRPDGIRLGYSGDFAWPNECVIEVDALVVDSTYGSPDRKREYSQDDVEQELCNLVRRLLKSGPVELLAHRGTSQRALQILTGQITCPLIGSKHGQKEADVHRAFGYCIDEIVSPDSPVGREALLSGNYIRIYSTKDRKPVDAPKGSRITLSAFMTTLTSPLLEYSPRSYRVALSDHADFDGTLEYIRATRAKHVVTDNTRGGNALSLAMELQNRLGINARPSTNRSTKEWGKQ